MGRDHSARTKHGAGSTLGGGTLLSPGGVGDICFMPSGFEAKALERSSHLLPQCRAAPEILSDWGEPKGKAHRSLSVTDVFAFFFEGGL